MRSFIIISILVGVAFCGYLGTINGLKVTSSDRAIDNSVTVAPLNEKQRSELKIYTETGKTGLIDNEAADEVILDKTNEINAIDELDFERKPDEASEVKSSVDPFGAVPFLENDLLPPLTGSIPHVKSKSVRIQTTTESGRDLQDTENLVRLNGLVKSVELGGDSSTVRPITVAPSESVIEQTAIGLLLTLSSMIKDNSKTLEDDGKLLTTANRSPVTVGPILSIQGASIPDVAPTIQTNVVVTSPLLDNKGSGGLESTKITSPITVQPTVPTVAAEVLDDRVVLGNSGELASSGLLISTAIKPISINLQETTIQTEAPPVQSRIVTSGGEALQPGNTVSSSELLPAPGLVSVNGLLINSQQLSPGRLVNTGDLTNTPAILDSGAVASGGAVLTPSLNIEPNPFSSIPQNTEYRKQFFSFSAPDEDEEEVIVTKQLSNILKKNLQTLFIKSPENNAATKVLLNLAKQAVDQKSVIYVLTKEDESTQIIGELQKMQENMPIKPDVTFIKYKNPDDLAHAKEQIKSKLDSMSGISQDIDGGVAPVLKFESTTTDVPNKTLLPITKGVSLGDIVTGAELVTKTSDSTSLPSNPL